jgi:uncharacterized protein YutE (UPF0331/DUF86 family)
LANVDEVVLDLLRLLRDEVNYLKSEREFALSFSIYEDNTRLKKAVERSLQLSGEICLDIGRRLASREGFPYAQDNRGVFRILATEDVIPKDLLPTMLSIAAFRNLVVHDYARIDDARVYDILKNNLEDFDRYAEAIYDYVHPTSEPDEL